jgi:class 3 adenylate cyclase/tetratricopeptide (TPR) repeat protein
MATCAACGFDNPAGAKFCLECGSRFAAPGTCASCGTVNPEGATFCLECGAALTSSGSPPPVEQAVAPQEVRKVVTTIFSDLKGSTSLGEQLDSEALREVMSRYFDAMSAELARHGGTIEKFIGDAIMAVFGLPTLHEDDALRAVRAALGMQRALEELNDELDRIYGVRLVNRTGVNTGEVVAAGGETDQRLVTGDVVNVAARLEQAAGACEVLLGDLTYRLVRDHVEAEPVEPLELKGKAERVPAYRLLGLRETPVQPARRLPLVGREIELRQLEDLFATVVTTRRCGLATVAAEAGAGKSRIVEELLGRAGDARVVAGRCLPYGDGITFWPLSEAVRDAAGVHNDDDADTAYAKIVSLAGADGDDVAARIAAATGLRPAPFAVDELVWATRRLFETLADTRPLIVVFEDIHWAESTFLELLERLLDEVENAPILLLCPTRPALFDARPKWGVHERAVRIELARLDGAESAQLVRNLLGGAELGRDVEARIAAAADGNPLFVEQLLSMLIDDGTITPHDGGWQVTGDLDRLSVPPTIQALLAARLDSLSPTERAVIQPAAVVGYRFPQDAVEHLVDQPLHATVPTELARLTRKQLVRLDPHDEGAYRFEHILVRDTAYDSILKRGRAKLHEAFVEWADRVNRDRAVEFEEILGFHLEQACRYLAELGPLDDHARALGADGARRLAAAGRRAFERGDAAAAASLLRRAADLLPESDPRRLELLPDHAEALLQVGSFTEAHDAIERGLQVAGDDGSDAVAAKLRLVGLLVQLRTGHESGWQERVADETARAIALFEKIGDHEGLAKAWRLRGWSSGIACRFADTAEAAERALEHARRAGDVRQARRQISSYGTAMVFGPTPVAVALERCSTLLEDVRGDRQTEGWLLARLASLHAMAGDVSLARDLCGRAMAMLQELRLETEVVFLEVEAWRIEMVAGDLGAAERLLRHGYDHLVGIGETYLLSTVAGLLAQTVFEEGRLHEMAELADLTEELATDDDVDTQALWRCVRGKLWSAQGRHEDAEALIREALTVLESTDAVLLQTATLLDLATVLERAGRDEARRDALTAALDLAEQKGDRATADHARRLLGAPARI